MTVRLATEHDIPLLLSLLEDMGQFWSPEALKDRLVDPWITAVRETNGVIDAFYFCRAQYHIDGKAYLGPAGGPTKSHADWLRAICELGIFIDEEETRRRPKIDRSKCWIATTMWPQTAVRSSAEQTFNFKARTQPDKEGFDTKEDGARTYWTKRDTLVAQAKAVLAAKVAR